jgi:hypothetical protein
MTEFPAWHPGEKYADVADEWKKEFDICKALGLAADEEFYAQYCGYDRLMLAAKAEIERLALELQCATADNR